MAKFTVTDTLKSDGIPMTGHPKGCVFQNTGDATAYWGWEAGLAASGDAQGVPLAPGEWRSVSARDHNLQTPLRFICGDGETTTINYTRNT